MCLHHLNSIQVQLHLRLNKKGWQFETSTTISFRVSSCNTYQPLSQKIVHQKFTARPMADCPRNWYQTLVPETLLVCHLFWYQKLGPCSIIHQKPGDTSAPLSLFAVVCWSIGNKQITTIKSNERLRYVKLQEYWKHRVNLVHSSVCFCLSSA